MNKKLDAYFLVFSAAVTFVLVGTFILGAVSYHVN
jgi:hypothetical protein